MNWNIGLDIGTSGVRMAVKERGVVYRQSAAIARRVGNAETLAVGNEALKMLNRVPEDVQVGFPMLGGVIADEDLLRRWYQYLLRHVLSAGLVHRPRVLLSCAPQVQLSMRRVMVALMMDAGASACSVVRSDAAAALGAPLEISKPQARLVVDLGAGSMCAAVIAGGRVIRSRSLPYGMQSVDEAIVRRMRVAHKMVLSHKAAEELKLSLVGASAPTAPSAAIAAMDAVSGFPRHYEVRADELKDAAQPIVSQLMELIHQVLDGLSPELAADLSDGGVVLTGGGAQLFGLPLMIAERFNMACHLTDDPSACVARGLSKIMDSQDTYDHLITAHTSILEKRLPGKG